MSEMQGEMLVHLSSIIVSLCLSGRTLPRDRENFRTTGPLLMQNQFTRRRIENRLCSHVRSNYEAVPASGLFGIGLRTFVRLGGKSATVE